MTFQKSPYELDLRYDDKWFYLVLSINKQYILDIRFDTEYLLSMYGFFYSAFVNSVPFGITFPPTNRFESISIYCHYQEGNCHKLTIEKTTLNKESIKYEILIDSDAEDDEGMLFLEMIEEYVDIYACMDYNVNDEDYDYSDLEAVAIDLQHILSGKGRIFL